MPKISLITMGQGNVSALKKTLDSFAPVVDEFIYGDLLIFQEDREVIEEYKKRYHFKAIKLPFNYIFKAGFSNILNYLAENASNDIVIYMNTSEVIGKDNGILQMIEDNPECNAFFFDHETDKHRWYRCYDRRELAWSGVLHEELRGNYKPYHKPIFRMKDEEKDMDDPFKAAVFNSVKELVYFQNYLKLVDRPHQAFATNHGWITFAKEQYRSMVERLEAKGKQYEAFKTGNYSMFMDAIFGSNYFTKEIFESSDIINFQGNRKSIL